MRGVGWILDVYIDGVGAAAAGEVAIWVRTDEGRIVKLRDRYSPTLYVLPTRPGDAERIFAGLRDEPHIKQVSWVEKFTSLDDAASSKQRLLQIQVGLPKYRELLRVLRGLDHPPQVFNADLLHVQQYLFGRLKIEPTSKVRFSSDDGDFLTEIERLDDENEFAPPPFTTVTLDLSVLPSSPSLVPDSENDPIQSITLRCGDEDRLTLLDGGTEEEILKALEEYIRLKDPDIIVAPSCDDFTFPYLLTRARRLGLDDLQLGRETVDLNALSKPLPGWLRGRVAIDCMYYGATADDWGIAGLVERARFAFLPPGIAGRWTANRVNDSRICYELMQRGFVIPRDTGYFESIRPVEDIFDRDRGGIIISQKVGEVHQNVAEIDYESEFPNIIVKENISFETVTTSGMRKKADAILPSITKRILERRLHFKRLKKSFEKGSREWNWCEQRQQAGKMVLVCIYGTSGCCWNRFGNVLAFEEINRKSRKVMVKTKEHVQDENFEIIRAVVDSVFVKKPDASKADYERLARSLGSRTRLPTSLDHHFKFVMLLPLEGDPSMIIEAQNRYFGILYDGEVVARGIELRRHDTPPFIKDFQLELIKTLFAGYDTVEDVRSKGYERATLLVTEKIDQIMTGRVRVEDLVVSKILRKSLGEYRSLFPHVATAIRLTGMGKTISEGDNIQFLFTDANHMNPLCRVVAKEEIDDPAEVRVDREKYREMLLDAAETVLSTLGFSRASYGLPVSPRSWVEELWEERKRERQMETEATYLSEP